MVVFRQEFVRVVTEQTELFYRNANVANAPDATTNLAADHLPPSLLGVLLESLDHAPPTDSELALYECGKRGLSMDSFLNIYFGEQAKQLRMERDQVLAPMEKPDTIKPCPAIQPVDYLPVAESNLVIPDSEASDAALSGEVLFGRRVIEDSFEQVKKLSQNWRKAWQTRWIYLNANHGLGYYNKRPQERDRKLPKKTIPFAEILDVAVATADNTPGTKVKLRPESFNVTIQSGRVYTFTSEANTTAQQWCSMIASHVLVDAVKNNMGLERVQHFVEAGGHVDATINAGKQYPILALALINKANDVAEYLLQCGADASCLLRWSFVMVDRVLTASEILELLIQMKRDLNVCGDDQHRWTLLHYLALGANLIDIKRLVARVDNPTIQAIDTIGDSPLSLVLKTCPTVNTVATATEVGLFLVDRSDLYHKDNHKDGLLHLSIKQRCTSLSEQLVHLGADVNERDAKGDTALHLAIKTGQYDLVDVIVQHAHNLLIDLVDHTNEDTAFVLALKIGNEDMACRLLEAGASCNAKSANWDDQRDMTNAATCKQDHAIHVAIKMGMKRLAMMCVNHGADVTEMDSQGRTALHLAILHNMYALAYKITTEYPQPVKGIDYNSEDLLREASPVNILDRTSKESPTMICFTMRQIELACELMDSGADLTLCNLTDESPIHRMVDLISTEFASGSASRHALAITIFRAMLATNETDPYLPRKPNYETPFHMVAAYQDESSVFGAAEALLAHDPELANARNSFGDSVLLTAAKSDNTDIAKLLVDGGCDLDVVNNVGDTALHVAVLAGNCEIVRTMLEHGAYPGTWDRFGNCPVHLAAAQGKCDVVEVFAQYCLQEGHLNYRAESGCTPALTAVINGQVAALKTLMEYNVDLKLLIPSTRKGILHMAVDTCLGDEISSKRKLGLISTLFALEVSALSVDPTDTNKASGVSQRKAPQQGEKGIFSASKCYETLAQIRVNLESLSELEQENEEANHGNATAPLEISNNTKPENLDMRQDSAEREDRMAVAPGDSPINLSDVEICAKSDDGHEDAQLDEEEKGTDEAKERPRFGVPIPFAQTDTPDSMVKRQPILGDSQISNASNYSSIKLQAKKQTGNNAGLANREARIPTSHQRAAPKRAKSLQQENDDGSETDEEHFSDIENYGDIASDLHGTTTSSQQLNDESGSPMEFDDDDSMMNLEFLCNLSKEDYNKVLEHLRDEARKTAQEFILSVPGERMMWKRAKALKESLADSGRDISEYEAFDMACDRFTKDHIQESVDDMNRNVMTQNPTLVESI